MNDQPCSVCGARVRNANPKTTTCSPICTRAKKAGRTRERQQEYEIAVGDESERWRVKGDHAHGPIVETKYGGLR